MEGWGGGGELQKGMKILTDSWAEMRDVPERANQEAGWFGKGPGMQMPLKGDHQWTGEMGRGGGLVGRTKEARVDL